MNPRLNPPKKLWHNTTSTITWMSQFLKWLANAPTPNFPKSFPHLDHQQSSLFLPTHHLLFSLACCEQSLFSSCQCKSALHTSVWVVTVGITASWINEFRICFCCRLGRALNISIFKWCWVLSLTIQNAAHTLNHKFPTLISWWDSLISKQSAHRTPKSTCVLLALMEFIFQSSEAWIASSDQLWLTLRFPALHCWQTVPSWIERQWFNTVPSKTSKICPVHFCLGVLKHSFDWMATF